MSDPMALKWAIVDLLKICDVAHEGRLHGDLARIARTLGVELSEPVAVRPAVLPLERATTEHKLDAMLAKKAARSVS